ncbi:hypothetical protein KHQ81_13015 [Mycoplasmatota bacterium]|nr:hypothetical protein KHQ81_13015 [Mycoplasmatota bacterium]
MIVSKLNEHGLKLNDFVGCIVSHSHNDHSIAINDLSRFMTIYASAETLKAKKIIVFNEKEQKDICTGKCKVIKGGTRTIIGTYSIVAFNTEHDCPGSLGFIITSNKTSESLLFLTDTKYIKFKLNAFRFNYVMIECNYVDELLESQEINFALKKRLINSHMSLTTCIKTLKSFDLSKCIEIYLVHLSDARSDEQLMKKEVSSEFGIMTYVCKKHGGVT